MGFHSKPHLNGRWGIYEGSDLLATIGCSESCEQIIRALKTRNPKIVPMKRYDALAESASSATLLIAQRLATVSLHEVPSSPQYTLN